MDTTAETTKTAAEHDAGHAMDTGWVTNETGWAQRAHISCGPYGIPQKEVPIRETPIVASKPKRRWPLYAALGTAAAGALLAVGFLGVQAAKPAPAPSPTPAWVTNEQSVIHYLTSPGQSLGADAAIVGQLQGNLPPSQTMRAANGAIIAALMNQDIQAGNPAADRAQIRRAIVTLRQGIASWQAAHS